MLSSLQAVLISPESFFEREAADPSLRGPVVIVAVVAVIGVLSSLPVMQAVLGSMPRGATPFGAIGLVIGVVVGIVGPFVVWLLYALVFYGLSALFDGKGEFRDVFVLIGWGFAPRIVSSIVGGLVVGVLVSQGDFATPQQAQELSRRAVTSPLGLLSRVVSLAMTLWSAWIWMHAVREARHLSRRTAAITVGIVVFVAIVLGLASSLFATTGGV